MLRLTEVASQSVTFSKRVLENHESKQLLNGWPKPGHYRAVFSIDRPPLLAVMRIAIATNQPPKPSKRILNNAIRTSAQYVFSSRSL